VSDRDPLFMSVFWKELLSFLNIQPQKVVAVSPTEEWSGRTDQSDNEADVSNPDVGKSRSELGKVSRASESLSTLLEETKFATSLPTGTRNTHSISTQFVDQRWCVVVHRQRLVTTVKARAIWERKWCTFTKVLR